MNSAVRNDLALTLVRERERRGARGRHKQRRGGGRPDVGSEMGATGDGLRERERGGAREPGTNSGEGNSQH